MLSGPAPGGTLNDTPHYDIVVIGTGPAGRRAAIQAAKGGKRVAAVDRQRYVGGQAVHRGTIPSKTLREAVIHVTGIGQRSFYGESYRVMADVTMHDLLLRTAQVVQAEVDVVRDGFLRNDVDLLNGVAHFVDPHTLAIHTENSIIEVRADKIILATGSNPSRPAHIPFDQERVVDSDGILDLPRIPKSLTVVGRRDHRHGVRQYFRHARRRGDADRRAQGTARYRRRGNRRGAEIPHARGRHHHAPWAQGGRRGIRQSRPSGHGARDRRPHSQRRGDVFDRPPRRDGTAESRRRRIGRRRPPDG